MYPAVSERRLNPIPTAPKWKDENADAVVLYGRRRPELRSQKGGQIGQFPLHPARSDKTEMCLIQKATPSLCLAYARP